MTESDEPSTELQSHMDRLEQLFDYGELHRKLQAAMVEIWTYCEDNHIGDFAEAISQALAGTAKTIAMTRFAVVLAAAGGLDRDAAQSILVKQRTGSWEASLVCQLMADAELSDAEWHEFAERLIAEQGA